MNELNESNKVSESGETGVTAETNVSCVSVTFSSFLEYNPYELARINTEKIAQNIKPSEEELKDVMNVVNNRLTYEQYKELYLMYIINLPKKKQSITSTGILIDLDKLDIPQFYNLENILCTLLFEIKNEQSEQVAEPVEQCEQVAEQSEPTIEQDEQGEQVAEQGEQGEICPEPELMNAHKECDYTMNDNIYETSPVEFETRQTHNSNYLELYDIQRYLPSAGATN